MSLFGLAKVGWKKLKSFFASPNRQAYIEEDDNDASSPAFPPVVLSAKAKAMLAEGQAVQKDREVPRECVLRGSLQDRMSRGGR